MINIAGPMQQDAAKNEAIIVPIVPEMIARAETNLRAMDIENATVQNTSGEALPFDDNLFNVVISDLGI